jgi:pimeloyl-ACP methyl ester carboxylesterase
MMKVLRRVAVFLVLLVVALYGLAFLYQRHANSQTFIGADLDGEEWLAVTDEVTLPWDTVRVTTSDGVRILLLESRLAESPDAPWVIYFYGNAGRIADSFAMYYHLREVGLNVLALDYRGYGASQKTRPSEVGVYADARAAWRHLTETLGVPAKRIVLYGYSLGGAVATQLATETSPAGLITRGTFTSSAAYVHSHFSWQPEALVRVLLKDRFENLEKARSLALPWLIFHGVKDSTVPFSHAEILAKTTAGNRRLVPLECGHTNALTLERDRMDEVLREFLRDLFDPGHTDNS